MITKKLKVLLERIPELVTIHWTTRPSLSRAGNTAIETGPLLERIMWMAAKTNQLNIVVFCLEQGMRDEAIQEAFCIAIYEQRYKVIQHFVDNNLVQIKTTDSLKERGYCVIGC